MYVCFWKYSWNNIQAGNLGIFYLILLFIFSLTQKPIIIVVIDRFDSVSYANKFYLLLQSNA